MTNRNALPSPGVTHPDKTNTAIIAVVILATVTAVGMVCLMVVGDQDSNRGNIILFISTMAGVITPLVGWIVSRKVDAVHLQLNGRMTQLLNETKESTRLQTINELTNGGTDA